MSSLINLRRPPGQKKKKKKKMALDPVRNANENVTGKYVLH